jgi:hypothetical protein
MTWQNVGVVPPYNRTKKLFKENVKAEPDTVQVYGTDLFHVLPPTRVSALGDGKYTVVGPDPGRERKWYATITVSHSSTGQRLVSVE